VDKSYLFVSRPSTSLSTLSLSKGRRIEQSFVSVRSAGHPASAGLAGHGGHGGRGDGCFSLFQLSGGSGASGASGVSGGYFYFFLTFPPVRYPATDCGYLYLYPEEETFRPK
jgi:hypothetical protein